jgi:hypothetical protein
MPRQAGAAAVEEPISTRASGAHARSGRGGARSPARRRTLGPESAIELGPRVKGGAVSGTCIAQAGGRCSHGRRGIGATGIERIAHRVRPPRTV